MLLRPIIVFRGIPRNDMLRAETLAHAEKLETFYRFVSACRVLVELADRHHEAGNRVHVRIDLTVPGAEIVVTNNANLHANGKDAAQRRTRKRDEVDAERKRARVAIRRAFAIAARRLQDFARRERGDVKQAQRQPRGQISSLFPDAGYGFLEADDGHTVYFNRRSVLGDAFAKLRVGSAVLFAEERGDEGPQASTVKLARQPRTHGIKRGSAASS